MMRIRSRRLDLTYFKSLLLKIFSIGVVATLAACGSGGSGGSMGDAGLAGTNSSPGSGPSAQSCSSSCGGAMISLSDAAGDFDSYIVNVVSLQLTRSDGTVVQTLPVTTQVNFAQLVNLSEIVSTAQIPAGRYVSASLTLDFSGATIVVDNGTTGVTIAAGNIIDGATSLPLAAPNSTQMTLTLSFAADNQLVVTPNSVANLALDFNLLASNTVAPSASNPTTVTVNPVLTASLVPDTTKQLRVRGPLVSVSTTGSSYNINVRPFYNDSGTSGQLTVNTTTSTTYSINGTSYTGAAGLTQLATLATGTLTVAYGSWSTSTQSFTATSVLAGSSVAGTTMDSIEGTVVARAGDTLTLDNGILNRPSWNWVNFMSQVTATVGTGTTVTELGVPGSFAIQDISVGQHVQLLGSFSTGSTGNGTLDATSGSAQLDPTDLVGTVTGSTANLVTLNLQSLDGRAPSVFNFAGTGTSSAQDATATAYTVNVPAGLSAVASLSTGLPVRFTGFVSPFGSAPPDFVAQALVSYAQTAGVLDVRWAMPGLTAPFATLTGSELLISQTTLNSSAQDYLRIASVTLNPATVSTGLEIVPDASATNPQFAIAHLQARNIDGFSTFADFVTALTSDLNGTDTMLQILAYGPYNATTGVLQAEQMIVVLDQ
ncbi:MAG: DUF4382 domain-containing protein [Steroidobacteraceae bacterium]